MNIGFPSPNFFIGSIHIKSVEGASCINFGNNYPTSFQSHKKHNQGFGTINGDYSSVLGAKSKQDHTRSLDIMRLENGELPDFIKEAIYKSQGT